MSKIRNTLLVGIVAMALITTLSLVRYSFFETWYDKASSQPEIVDIHPPDSQLADGNKITPTPQTPPPTLRRTPTKICTGDKFTPAREVFLDDECYPPTYISIPKLTRKTDESKLTNSIEIFTTQNWKSSYSYEFEHNRPEPAKLKTFDDVIVYRTAVSTYIKGTTIWTASMRCLGSEPNMVPQALTGPSPDTVTVELDEAVLSASEIWVSLFMDLLQHKLTRNLVGIWLLSYDG
jgi:hypothetical protein